MVGGGQGRRRMRDGWRWARQRDQGFITLFIATAKVPLFLHRALVERNASFDISGDGSAVCRLPVFDPA